MIGKCSSEHDITKKQSAQWWRLVDIPMYSVSAGTFG